VTMSTNSILDSDNNDVLLGLVAMFRHADRTPKQKVKLKTKSATLCQLFDEQLAANIAAAAAGEAAAAGKASTKKKSDTTKDKSKEKDGKSSSSSSAAAAASSEKIASSPSSVSLPVDVPSTSSAVVTPAKEKDAKEGKADKKEKGEVQYKDLKFKKKPELVAIRDAIKVLLVKEKLREKRKIKAEAILRARQTAEGVGVDVPTTPTMTVPVAMTTPSSLLIAVAVDSSEDEAEGRQRPHSNTSASSTSAIVTTATTTSTATATPTPAEREPLSPQIDALEDGQLEAAITLELQKDLKRDAEKDPEYVSKLYQIGQVLEKGYGGVKVQLKPKKIEKGKVVQALLIVK
jgi:hypothetical protein